jgi:N,N'-diacetylchitobiose transport system permease protein
MTAQPLSPPRAPHAPVVAGRRRNRRNRRTGLLPYALITPALLVLALVLGFPLVKLVLFSLQKFGLAQQFGTPAPFVGLANYHLILTDPQFWTVLGRTVIFCVANVALTMVLGTLIAVLAQRINRVLRVTMLTMLLLVWAMPPISSTIVWQWMFDSQYGLVNWLLTAIGLNFHDHSWLVTPFSFFVVATIVVVWMGIPFVTFTVFAGLTQVPVEVLEAAQLDGANGFQRLRHVVVPYLRPVLLILTVLSVLWDFQIFTQIYVLQAAGGIAKDTNLLGSYTYEVSIGQNRFDVGGAIAIAMVVLTLLFTGVYLRQMARQEDL